LSSWQNSPKKVIQEKRISSVHRGPLWSKEILFSWITLKSKFEYNRFSRRIRSHMRNGFREWIRALGGIVRWNKPRVENQPHPGPWFTA
jgi:hypothetical protein